MASREHNIMKWKEIIDRATASGIPIRQWCSENNIDKRSYYYWRKIIREEIWQEENPDHSTDDIRIPVVTEIRITEDPHNAVVPLAFESQIMILRNNCQVYIGQNASRDTLRMVMEVIG